jgi:hypothetical protein
MFHPLASRDCLSLVSDRTLLQRDFAVLFAMMAYCDTTTGRIKFMGKALAETFRVAPGNISTSISRLKKARVVAAFVDSMGEKYYMINPYYFSVGRRQKWGHSLVRFMSAFNNEERALLSRDAQATPGGSAREGFESSEDYSL